jgi:GTP cyclohydrolase I|nr:MAG TPA: GTP cyclohydrolase I [Bacteriophage sp.]
MRTDTTIDRAKLKDISIMDSVEDIFTKCINNMLVCIGDDPSREGLKRTPQRVFKAWDEIFEGMNYTNDEIADKYNVCFEDVESGDLVVEGHIPIYSMCEHHLLPMYNAYVSVGYIPNGKVIGLSKIARIAEMCAKRPQLQERIGTDIAEVLQKVLGTEDVIVVIEGEHACMTMRGVKKPGTVTRTAAMRGRFDSDHALRSEFYDLIRK